MDKIGCGMFVVFGDDIGMGRVFRERESEWVDCSEECRDGRVFGVFGPE